VSLEQKLLNLKREIAEDKEAAQRLQGQLDQIHQQIKTEFKCGTVKAAQTHLELLNMQLKEAEWEIERKKAKLDEEYEWEG